MDRNVIYMKQYKDLYTELTILHIVIWKRYRKIK